MLQTTDTKLRRIEVTRIGQEANSGTGIALTTGIDHFKIRYFLAVCKADAMHLTTTTNLHLQQLRECVNNGDTHPVETARVVVVVIVKLTAGMKLGQNQLNPWDTLLWVNVHRHTATIIGHRE